MTSDPRHYSLMRLDSVDTPRKDSASMNHSHSHSDSLKKEDDESFDDIQVNAHMATIRIQQRTLTNDTSNHQHSAGGQRYLVDVEFESSDDYSIVHSELSNSFPSLNKSLTLSNEHENDGSIDTANMKMQFSIGPETDILRDFVTSLCAAYPIPINHCIR